jgi:hypothetical protein
MYMEEKERLNSNEDRGDQNLLMPNIMFGINKEQVREFSLKCHEAKMNAQIGVYYNTIAH